jgi:hypothetical protein
MEFQKFTFVVMEADLPLVVLSPKAALAKINFGYFYCNI